MWGARGRSSNVEIKGDNPESHGECFHCCWRFTNYQSLPDELLAPAIKLYANTILLNAMISVVVEDQDVNRRSI